MRIFLWICVALLTAVLLVGAIPWVAMPEFRRTRQGRDILLAELGVAIVLAVLLSKLLGRPG